MPTNKKKKKEKKKIWKDNALREWEEKNHRSRGWWQKETNRQKQRK